MLKVGQLANRTGLTVRTLHHYEGIGVLVPSERTRAGHRLYSHEDVERLQRIVTLKDLGLSLDEIRQALDEETWTLDQVLERQLELVEEDLERLESLHGRLRAILDSLEASEPVTTDMLLQTIEHINMIDKHYTPEQLEQLAARREELGEEGMRKAEDEWAALIEAVRAEMERGTDPGAPEVRELARRWQSLIDAFTGGDPGIETSLKSMYREEGPDRASRGMVDAGVMAYVRQAMQHL